MCVVGTGRESGEVSTRGPEYGARWDDAMTGDIFTGATHDEVYSRVIDSYRLRVEDEYVFEHGNRGLYAREDPVVDFLGFLNKAEAGKLFPSWWSANERKACEKSAVDGGRNDVNACVQKHDIVERYHDELMPMRLRVFAGRVEGRQIGVV